MGTRPKEPKAVAEPTHIKSENDRYEVNEKLATAQKAAETYNNRMKQGKSFPEPHDIFANATNGFTATVTAGLPPICLQDLFELYSSDAFRDISGPETYKLFEAEEIDPAAFAKRVSYIMNSDIVKEINDLQEKIILVNIAKDRLSDRPGRALAEITRYSDPRATIYSVNAKMQKLLKFFPHNKKFQLQKGPDTKEEDSTILAGRTFNVVDAPSGDKTIVFLNYIQLPYDPPPDSNHFTICLYANHVLNAASNECRPSVDPRTNTIIPNLYVYKVNGKDKLEQDTPVPFICQEPQGVTAKSEHYMLSYPKPRCDYKMDIFITHTETFVDKFPPTISMVGAEVIGTVPIKYVTPKFDGIRVYVLIEEGYCYLVSCNYDYIAEGPDKGKHRYTKYMRAECEHIGDYPAPQMLFTAEMMKGGYLVMVRLLRFNYAALPFSLTDLDQLKVEYTDRVSLQSLDWLVSRHDPKYKGMLPKGESKLNLLPDGELDKFEYDGIIAHVTYPGQWERQVYMRGEQQHDMTCEAASELLGLDCGDSPEPGIQQITLDPKQPKGVLKKPRPDKDKNDSVDKIKHAERSTAAVAMLLTNPIIESRFAVATSCSNLPYYGNLTYMQTLKTKLEGKPPTLAQFHSDLSTHVQEMSTEEMLYLIGDKPGMVYNCQISNSKPSVVWQVSFQHPNVVVEVTERPDSETELNQLTMESRIDPDTYRNIHDGLTYTKGVPDPATLLYLYQTMTSMLQEHNIAARKLVMIKRDTSTFLRHIVSPRLKTIQSDSTKYVTVDYCHQLPESVNQPRFVVGNKRDTTGNARVRQMLWFTPATGTIETKHINLYTGPQPVPPQPHQDYQMRATTDEEERSIENYLLVDKL